ncbi:MAG: hypothetical protein Q4C72_02665 [Eubacteriales bacterium]|nr:hypothetical protein [Eubacteriales bacterium]
MFDIIKFIVLTFLQIAGDSKALLAAVEDDNEFVDGKATGKRLGTKYTCVAMKNQGYRFVVKIPGAAPIITQDELAASEVPVWVSFEGFQGRFYRLRGQIEYGLTCKAEKAVLVQEGGKSREKGA